MTPRNALTTACFTLALGAGCGAREVQLYDGPRLPHDQVVVLWSNPHLTLNIDRSYSMPVDDRSKLHRIEVPLGHHAVEVSCIYTDDVTYHPTGKGEAKPEGAQQFTQSRLIALLLDGQPGHQYKLRAHFTKDNAGTPGCRVKLFDVTNESGGHKVNFY